MSDSRNREVRQNIIRDKRISDRQQYVENLERQMRFKKRRRNLVIIVVCLGIVFVIFGPLGNIDRIKIQGIEYGIGGEDLIISTSKLHTGQRIFGLDTKKSAQRIVQIPWVEKANIDISLLGEARIKIIQRTPKVQLVYGDSIWFLDDTKRPFQWPASSSDTQESNTTDISKTSTVRSTLKVDSSVRFDLTAPLEGVFADAYTLASLITPELSQHISYFEIQNETILIAKLQGCGIVRFGDASLIEEKYLSLKTILSQVELRQLAVIDIGVPSSPTITRGDQC